MSATGSGRITLAETSLYGDGMEAMSACQAQPAVGQARWTSQVAVGNTGEAPRAHWTELGGAYDINLHTVLRTEFGSYPKPNLPILS